jgi:hypothetical protein
MSFSKYIETKIQPPHANISISAYKEKLEADLSSLVIKPNQQLIEAKRNIVNLKEVSKILSELKYPLIDEFNMAIRTADTKKVNHAHLIFRKWTEYSKPDSQLVDRIEEILFQYESNLFTKVFGPEQADEVAISSLAESKATLEHIAQKIDLAISSLSHWGNYSVVVEAVNPENGWIVSEAKIIIGDTFKAEFFIADTPLGLKTKSLKKEGLPPSMEADVEALLNKLNANPKYSKILTLYMTRPITDRRYFEMIKRDLSLGIQTVLPNHVLLTTMPFSEDQDVWKIKIEEKYLCEHLHEGDYKEFHLIGDEAPIKWIEQFRKANS